MMLRLALIGVVAAVAASACSGNKALSCEEDDRYVASISTNRVRVPDDLTLPDESEALVIPSEVDVAAAGDDVSCLELPPGYILQQEQEDQ